MLRSLFRTVEFKAEDSGVPAVVVSEVAVPVVVILVVIFPTSEDDIFTGPNIRNPIETTASAINSTTA